MAGKSTKKKTFSLVLIWITAEIQEFLTELVLFWVQGSCKNFAFNCINNSLRWLINNSLCWLVVAVSECVKLTV